MNEQQRSTLLNSVQQRFLQQHALSTESNMQQRNYARRLSRLTLAQIECRRLRKTP
jgi:hypothetical protein